MFLQKKAAEIEELIKQAKAATAEKEKEAIDTKDVEDEINKALGLGADKEADAAQAADTASETSTEPAVDAEQGIDAKANPLAAIIDYCKKGMYGDAVKIVVEYADKNEFGVSQTIQSWTAKVEEALGPDTAQAFSAAVREGMTQSVNNDKQELKAEKKQQEQSATGTDVPAATDGVPGATPDEQLKDDAANLSTAKNPTEGNEAGDIGADFMAGEEEEKLTPETTGQDPIGDDLKSKNSLFDYLTKTAYDVNELAGMPATAEPAAAPAVDEAVIDEAKATYQDYVDKGVDCDAAKLASDMAAAGFTIDEATAQKAIDEVENEQPSDLGDKVQNMDKLIAGANAYQPEASAEDALLEVAKSAASAADFLEKIATVNKVAKPLDEASGSPEHPGKKLFNGDKVSYTNGDQQYFPGQKVFQERKGGNAPVESVHNVAGKPDVDVYNPQVSKKHVTSITDAKGGTIAFMQPIKLDEPTHLEAGFDYTGIVTGELQKTKETKEQLAGAGHKTADYLDKIDKLSDKEKVAGDLPETKTASAKDGLYKKAIDMNDEENPDTTPVNPDEEFNKELEQNGMSEVDVSKERTSEYMSPGDKIAPELRDRLVRFNELWHQCLEASDAGDSSTATARAQALTSQAEPIRKSLIDMLASYDTPEVTEYVGDIIDRVKSIKNSAQKLLAPQSQTAPALAGAEASAKSGLSKKASAGFSFSGLKKTAEEVSAQGSGTIGTDATAAVGKPEGDKKRELSDEQLVAAQGDIKDRDASLDAAK